MRRPHFAIVLAATIAGACAGTAAAPAAPATPDGSLATNAPVAAPTKAPPTTAASRRATTTPAAPLPEAFIGAWYHPAPAYWWFLRAGSPTCIVVAHTDGDCVAYQLGAQAAYVGAAAMDGRLIRIHWTRGYCAGRETDFGTGVDGDTLKLFDTEGDCGGDNFVLTRAGIGAAPSAPPPPEN